MMPALRQSLHDHLRRHVSIYVEIRIRAPLDAIWLATQDPARHQRWDLRFTEIAYLPRADDAQPQRFLYATRIGLGLRIRGEGETVGTRDAEDARTSALRFWSDDAKSLIREGSGYWKYVPTENGVRFLTWYDYRTRFGIAGAAANVVFRPLMRWATAWSFDRLRLWLERDIPPEISLQRSVVHAVVRLGLVFIFAWHGLVPKLLAHDADEIAMLADAGVSAASVGLALRVIGFAELAWALVLLVSWRTRSTLAATGGAMLVALIAVAIRSPQYLSAAFNPVTLNIAVALLALVGWLVGRDLPSASHCTYQRPSGES
jgi:DoxX-like family